MLVSDETPFAGGSPAITASQACHQLSQLCRLFASDRQLRDFRAGFGCHSPDDHLFLRWGAGAPQSLVDSLSSLSRELVDARRFSSDLQGANRPPSQRLGFRLIGNDSLLLLLVHLCLGDNHAPSHLTLISPRGVTPPP